MISPVAILFVEFCHRHLFHVEGFGRELQERALSSPAQAEGQPRVRTGRTQQRVECGEQRLEMLLLDRRHPNRRSVQRGTRMDPVLVTEEPCRGWSPT